MQRMCHLRRFRVRVSACQGLREKSLCIDSTRSQHREPFVAHVGGRFWRGRPNFVHRVSATPAVGRQPRVTDPVAVPLEVFSFEPAHKLLRVEIPVVEEPLGLHICTRDVVINARQGRAIDIGTVCLACSLQVLRRMLYLAP